MNSSHAIGPPMALACPQDDWRPNGHPYCKLASGKVMSWILYLHFKDVCKHDFRVIAIDVKT